MMGRGQYTYRVIGGWAKLPSWLELKTCSDVAVDSKDRVYLLDVGNHPVIVFDRGGNFLFTWGEGQFRHVHGIYIGPDDSVYVTDNYAHVVMKFTPEGKLLQTLGMRDVPSATYYGQPFNMPSGVALGPSGFIYVSDGYGNRRVHKFAPDGTLVLSWGEPGNGPGQFALVHNIAVDGQERVYVCDRENDRIQVFDETGRFITQWTNLREPADIYISKDDVVYVVEMGRKHGMPRISLFSVDGRELSRWDNAEGAGRGTIEAPHGLWVDSHGDIYVAEYGNTPRIQKFALVN